MRRFVASLLAAAVAATAHAYCDPQLPSTAAVVTLGAVGTETIAKAYAALPPAGGVISVPYGTYGCEQAFWNAGQSSVMKSFTLKGVPDSNGNRPQFVCGSGTVISFGLPYFAADGVTPNPTPNVTVTLDGVEVDGWTSWVVMANERRLVINNSKFDGRYGGVVVTGQGITKGEMEDVIQDSATEVCGSEFAFAGQGNQYHPLYIHGGPWIDKGLFAFVNSYCHDAQNAICVKSTVSGKVVVKNSTVTNLCTDPVLAPNNCGTNLVDGTSAAKLAWIEGNTLTRGTAANNGQNLGTSQLVTVNDRLYNFGGLSSGGAFSPLYDRPWGSAAWNDASFWSAATASPNDYTNPYLRLTVFKDNVFTNYANAKSAILSNGTAPGYLQGGCMMPLSIPANWAELNRVVVINNTFTGNWPLAVPWEFRGLSWCSGQTDYTGGALASAWDLGGNSINNTVAKVVVPSWLSALGGVIATPTSDLYSTMTHTILGGRKSPTSLPAWRTSMTANTWKIVSSNSLSNLDPTADPAINPNYPSTAPWNAQTGFSAYTGNWDGAVWDEGNLVFWMPIGGGHNGYAGNEGYKLDLSASNPTWVRVNYPSGSIQNPATLTTGAGQESSGTWSDGRLRPGHTYQHVVYWPGHGPVWLYQSAASFASSNNQKTWAMNLSTMEWAWVATAPYVTSAFDMGGTWDSKRNVAYLMPTSQSAKMHQFDPATNTWTANKFSDSYANTYHCGINLQYLPEKDAVVEIYGNCNGGSGDLYESAAATSVATWNLTSGVRTRATVSGSPPSGLLFYSDYTGYAWDGTKLLVWHNSANTCQIGTLTPNSDMSVWTWGMVSVASQAVCPTVRLVNGTYNRFSYSKKLKGVVLQNATTDKTYFYATE